MTEVPVGVLRAVVLARFAAADVETVFVEAEPQIGTLVSAEFAGRRALFYPYDFLLVHVADDEDVRTPRRRRRPGSVSRHLEARQCEQN